MEKEIQDIAIAGVGTMGTSIGQTFAENGYHVVLYGRRDSSIEKGEKLISIFQENELKEGRKKEDEICRINDNITYSTDMACFSDADLVVESITENMDMKQEFWRAASAVCRKNAILTSNTSGLSLTRIADAVICPERFCGMHWLNPPHICPLVEVVPASATGDDTVDAACRIVQSLKHVPVRLKKEIPGFLVNRFQFAVLREAMSLVEEGIADKEDVDKVFKYGLGLRYACLGPFEIADLGGLDVFYNIAKYLFHDLSDVQDVHAILKELVESGKFGVKAKAGFYDYGDGKDLEAIAYRDRMYQRVSDVLYGRDQ